MLKQIGFSDKEIKRIPLGLIKKFIIYHNEEKAEFLTSLFGSLTETK